MNRAHDPRRAPPEIGIAEYADFADALRSRRCRTRDAVPSLVSRLCEVLPAEALAPFLETTSLVSDVLAELDAAESELRAQNDALFDAQVGASEEAHAYRELFEQAPTPTIETDRYGAVQRANVAACTLLRCSLNALARKPLVTFVLADDRHVFRSALTRSFGSRQIESWPVRLVPTRATAVPCRARTRALGDSSGRTRALLWHIQEDDPAEDLF